MPLKKPPENPFIPDGILIIPPNLPRCNSSISYKYGVKYFKNPAPLHYTTPLAVNDGITRNKNNVQKSPGVDVTCAQTASLLSKHRRGYMPR